MNEAEKYALEHEDWEITRVFLESEGVYRKFRDNLKVSDHCCRAGKSSLIDRTLRWTVTEEGNPFWSNINERIKSFLKSDNVDPYVKIGKFLDKSSHREEFIDFLTEKNACKKYFDNFNLDWDHSTNKNCLMDCFSWRDTSDGMDFWDGLDDDWKALISKAPKDDLSDELNSIFNGDPSEPIGEYEMLVRGDEDWEETASFLKTEGAYDKFITNVRGGDRTYLHAGDTLITRSIWWHGTPEGDCFWSELHDKYLSRDREEVLPETCSAAPPEDWEKIKEHEDWDNLCIFLKKKDIFEKYMERIVREVEFSLHQPIIYTSFGWFSSPDGKDFWSELNNEFERCKDDMDSLDVDPSVISPSDIKSSKPFEKYEVIEDIVGYELVDLLTDDNFDIFVKKFGYHTEMEWNDENFTWIKESIEGWEEAFEEFIVEIEDDEGDVIFKYVGEEIHVLAETHSGFFVWMNTEHTSLTPHFSSIDDATCWDEIRKFNSFSEGYEWMTENKPEEDYDIPF